MTMRHIQTAISTALATVLFAPFAAVGASGCDKAAKQHNVRVEIGEPFLKARARIVRSGWKPIRMHSSDGYKYDGAEKRLTERAFYEVDSCSIDAGARCILYYRKANECLRVDTIGEQVSEMKVTRRTTECPEAGS